MTVEVCKDRIPDTRKRRALQSSREKKRDRPFIVSGVRVG